MDFLNGVNALTLVFIALLVFAIAYRFYGIFLANKVLKLNAANVTPAIEFSDGKDYVATNRTVLFGHHFAAIAAAGPLVGPVLAAQFGYLPGTLWILIGCVLGGGVHDMVVLFASVRHKGESLATIAGKEIGTGTGLIAGIAILFILILTLAGLSLACISAMHEASWSLFTVIATMPIALIMGLIMRYRKDSVILASIFGGIMLIASIVGGHELMQIPAISHIFHWKIETISIAITVYGFLASVLPVWLLLVPRDYLSTYLKIGTILMLTIGVIFVHPRLQMPALTQFVSGGGPVIGGPVLPFIFIVIACGAISGFHAIIATGTTPKMLANEKEILFVGYGAMLVEGFVALMALIAACTLVPGDYFAINTPKEMYESFIAQNPNLKAVDLAYFSEKIGVELQGRTGGAVSLAVGMAHIFNKIPYMDDVMAYWYNFAIMFEAVFILTAIDAGTRVGRFFLQEMIGRVIPRFNDKNWMPGIIISSLLFTFSWGYLVYTGNVSSIWPLFGISNQLLAACGLIVCTTMLIRMNRKKYALCAAIPGVFMALITFWAGYEQVVNMYMPKGQYLLAFLACIAMVLMFIVFVNTFKRWYQLSKMKADKVDYYGATVKELVER
ncbi:MAG TPA: carbon starvation protein A [Pedobacter sp.]|uniref:carbon starvation CstA family protein n=1 Tax=Pedobacter sp. TaxID=1411316 RepID=UPI002C79CA6C|nr:carbon starvation protein A [Pedobacter sp.]HMI03379.1 carbon starvation protein A [Pedobacter sp.]